MQSSIAGYLSLRFAPLRYVGAVRISKKTIFLSALIFAAATVVFLQVVKSLAHKHREQVQQELQKVLGKDVTFDGFEVRLWPRPGFSAREFRVADDSRFAATPFVRARELNLGVNVWYLLIGRVSINSLTFQDPEFQVITNESGLLNTSVLASRKKDLGVLPKFHVVSPEKRHTTVSFDVTRIKVTNGRLDFIDRSVREPAELQVKNIEMEVNGLDSTSPTKIKFTAGLTEGLTYDMRIQGVVGPLLHERDWSQQPLDIEMQFDSLYLPSLTRALPALRNKIPRQLKVTGPMALEARLAGTLQRPRISNLVLKASLFGSPDYNAVLKGDLMFPTNGDWTAAELNGTLSLDRLNLMQVNALPPLQGALPPSLTSQGPVNLTSRFEGTWSTLRIGALAEANDSEIGIAHWFRKPAGHPAKLRAQISRLKDRLILHDSVLSFGDSKTTLSGLIDNSEKPKFQLNLRTVRSPLALWAALFFPTSPVRPTGSVDWDLLLEKTFGSDDGQWSLRGKLNIADTNLTHEHNGVKIDHLNANVAFFGTEARVQNATFDYGHSHVALTAAITDLNKPVATYQLWSREVNVADLPLFSGGAAIKLKNVNSGGEVQFQNGAALLKGTLVSSEGSLQNTPFRDLQTEIAWLPVGFSMKNLSLRAFGGTVRSDGLWMSNDLSRRFELAPQLQSVDVRELLAQIMPQLQNRIIGRLDFRGKLNATSQNDASAQDALKGSGEAAIQNGVLKDFNLINQFLIKGNRSSRSQRLSASLVSIVDRPDTPFELLKANFTVDRPDVLNGDLLLATDEYTISGTGWIRLDRSTKWTGVLLLSPNVTQQLQQEYRTLRYFIDRRGRLAISFRAEGTIPNITIRPENRLLAQALRWGSSQGAGESQDADRKRNNWLPRSLDKLLGR